MDKRTKMYREILWGGNVLESFTGREEVYGGYSVFLFFGCDTSFLIEIFGFLVFF